MTPRSLYLAQVSDSWVEIDRDDTTLVDSFEVPLGAMLLPVLVAHGWWLTGHRVAGSGWGVIVVEPSRTSGDGARPRKSHG